MSDKKSSGGKISSAIRIAYRVVSFCILYAERWFRHVIRHGRWAWGNAPATQENIHSMCVRTGGTSNTAVIITSWILVVIGYFIIFLVLVCWSFIRAIAPN